MSPLLILAILLIVLCLGLGFAFKLLWLGLIVGIILVIADVVRGRGRRL
jgi:hypothetical protein